MALQEYRPVRYILFRDGKEVMRGSMYALVQYVHRSHAFSFEEAVRHQGYSYQEE